MLGAVIVAAAEAIRGARGRTHSLVLDGEALTHTRGGRHIDTAGIDICGRRLARITLVTARMRSHAEERLRKALGDQLPPERCYPTVRAAVAARRAMRENPPAWR